MKSRKQKANLSVAIFFFTSGPNVFDKNRKPKAITGLDRH